jgi:hypothetical protein
MATLTNQVLQPVEKCVTLTLKFHSFGNFFEFFLVVKGDSGDRNWFVNGYLFHIIAP